VTKAGLAGLAPTIADSILDVPEAAVQRDCTANTTIPNLIEDFEAKNIQDANEEARPSEAVVELHVWQ
jgi:hypothetical protein